jgi:hypothetical protein
MEEPKESWQENYKLILYRLDQQDKVLAEIRVEQKTQHNETNTKVDHIQKDVTSVKTEISNYKTGLKVAVTLSTFIGSLFGYFLEHFIWKKS